MYLPMYSTGSIEQVCALLCFAFALASNRSWCRVSELPALGALSIQHLSWPHFVPLYGMECFASPEGGPGRVGRGGRGGRDCVLSFLACRRAREGREGGEREGGTVSKLRRVREGRKGGEGRGGTVSKLLSL